MMSVFGILKLEPVIRIGDKTRIDATKSFVSKGGGTLETVEIEAEDGLSGYVDVTGNSNKDWFLDWVFSGTSRSAQVNVRVTVDGTPSVFQQTIEVLTEADDKLFSNDDDLTSRRSDILNWLKPGRSSFLNTHRQARDLILSRLDDEGKTDNNGDKLTADSFVDVSEVKEVAAWWTLHLIFMDLSNQVGDVFERDALTYLGNVQSKWNRAFLRYDRNNDGVIDRGEGDYAFQSIKVYRE